MSHARGFLAHLVFGLAAAAVIETGWRITDTRPRAWSQHKHLRITDHVKKDQLVPHTAADLETD